jgi:hypothetical protein
VQSFEVPAIAVGKSGADGMSDTSARTVEEKNAAAISFGSSIKQSTQRAQKIRQWTSLLD